MNVKPELPLSCLREVVEDSVCIAQMVGEQFGSFWHTEGSKSLDGMHPPYCYSTFYQYYTPDQ